MKTYISILRGINVGGQKSIKMDALKEIYESLQLLNIQTYIQSGNVVFQANYTNSKDLEKKISDQIQKYLGFEVPVIILEKDELKDIIEKNPYRDDDTKDISHLHVTLLNAKPVKVNAEAIHEKKTQGEELTIVERAVYLYCPNGYGRTKLTNTFFENCLKVQATTRNWKTALELLNIAK